MNTLIIKFMKNIFRYFFLLFILLTIIMTYNMMANMKSRNIDDAWRYAEKNAMKYILLWSKRSNPEWSKYLRPGDVSFRNRRCKYDNCFVTDNDKLLPSVATFDAILFDGVEISKSEKFELPHVRHPEQLYIFSSKQSAATYPVCNPKYDEFFNLTWTYKLDSDVHWPYFYVYDDEEKEIGPRINMKWATTYLPTLGQYTSLFRKKQDAAIWIASNCNTNSRREKLVNNLKYALKRNNMTLETVGKCGLKKCPEKMEEQCLMLMFTYYFYFAFENSLAEDFITDIVIKAHNNFIIPIVFGDANYSRFLPPLSYIDITKTGVAETLQLMEFLMGDMNAYLDYFRWRNHYVLAVTDQFVCKVCEAVNTGVKKVYTDFRKWWNPKSSKAYGRTIRPMICKNIIRKDEQ